MKYVSEDPPLWPEEEENGIFEESSPSKEHEMCFRFLLIPLHSSTGYTDKLKGSIFPTRNAISLTYDAAISHPINSFHLTLCIGEGNNIV